MHPRPIAAQGTSLVAAASSTAHAMALGRLYASAGTAIVIVGETGTGKTELAQWIHAVSPRADGPFVDFTAAELSETLATSQLFGHERGAFTGALNRHVGHFGRAGGGTLLCDDLHLMPKSVQAVFLRALSRGRYQTVGGERDLPVQCRIIVGLRDCPDALMEAGQLLPDLRFRLGHCVIRLAPLRERPEDVVPLALEFLAQCPAVTGVSGPTGFAQDVLPALEMAAWPGNVRELRSVVQAAYLHAQADELVRFDHLPPHVQVAPRFRPYGDEASNARAMDWALWRTDGRVDAAAGLIGAHRNTVSKHLARRRMRVEVHIPPSGSVQDKEEPPHPA